MNIWQRFADLLPNEPLGRAEVIAHNSDGTSTVELPGGQQIRVRGTDVEVGNHAFIRSGRIEGQAPSLPFFDREV